MRSDVKNFVEVINMCYCYTCQNSNNLDRLHGYHNGSLDFLRWIKKDLESLGYKAGEHLLSDGISGVLARIDCEIEGAQDMLNCVEGQLKEGRKEK